ncbi:MAG: 4-hydroxy-3-methylbut-2-enyl diphosphate reductase [Candidatus Omnitrophica bacterium]|nr:4-hydroxy-3-methylbut-2-enyl diphosphate reductase [bacterium]MBK7497046.1 4-hydroxy-3-methylbut-2-enyl diphosphate reductase [Candidatus Omnitrophota bacterium]MBV6481968.1 4-hydroxy-3-methylbut-2-enyl diphosphate reductase [bacterium]MCK6496725.1 4-hydroxy-3-methylbut-2-enyl diphosphate reductase [bacterium]MCL4735142.1 4-hydroxy-3-methylbut-2-enyl diphosphate reductase [Candidatus Omnitrophota bacterium]
MSETRISHVPIFKRGFGLKSEVADELESDYHSELVQYLQHHQFSLDRPEVEIRLAREFGFCYGVDRAVDYAYETRKKFPEKRLFLTAEIIHNPRVNRRLNELGIQFLSGRYASGNSIETLTKEDVVLLPAFGVSTRELDRLRQTGCILVDTTCGSVANVWRRVERYSKEGYTSIIHGKYDHEETIATCSRAESVHGGQYLVVKDLEQTQFVCDWIRRRGDRQQFLDIYTHAVSPGFDPDIHLEKVGIANQTTMLSSESLEIARQIRQAIADHYGEEETQRRFLSFDTICSATQERQDAVIELCREGLDLMIVIGGFNSSNTGHLCEIGSSHCPTYHIDEVSRIDGTTRITHQLPHSNEIKVTENWLPEGKCRIGFTAGASTPNQVVGEVIRTVLNLKGATAEDFLPMS